MIITININALFIVFKIAYKYTGKMILIAFKKCVILPQEIIIIDMNRLYNPIIALIFIVTLCVTTSCNHDKEKVIAQETFSFLNDNWNFEQRLIIFEKEINTNKPCKIVLDLCCTKEFTAETLPVTLSLYDVEGSEFHRNNTFNFTMKKDMTEKVEGNLTTYTLTIYPKKYFTVKGKYKFRLLHTYYNYNLLGVRSVTVKVLEMKETEK